MKQSFRSWCTDRWYEHVEEVRMYEHREVEYNSRSYFHRYKNWLKREYKYQMGLLNENKSN